MYAETGSSASVGLLGIAGLVPLLVFALWGGWAKEQGKQIEPFVAAADTADRVRFVEQRHPVQPEFLSGPNTLVETNAALEELGEAPIDWFPAG